ncbi:MAG TPA: NAD(P)H-binding protein [Anaerolineaceae bacterium]|jgi:putative NADH-flavin reductase
MRIIIFGSGGQAGIELVTRALARGHRVTAFARDPESLGLQHPCLVLARGDVLDGASIRVGLAGQEAAISMLALGRGAGGLLLAEGMANLVQALQDTGVRRFICRSELGAGDGRDRSGWLRRAAHDPLHWKARAAELGIVEGTVKASALEWTIVRTGELGGGGGRAEISRRKAVDFILGVLETGVCVRQTVEVGGNL